MRPLLARRMSVAMGAVTDVAMESADITLRFTMISKVSADAIQIVRPHSKILNINLWGHLRNNSLGIPIPLEILFPLRWLLSGDLLAHDVTVPRLPLSQSLCDLKMFRCQTFQINKDRRKVE